MTRYAAASETCVKSWAKVMDVENPGVVRGLAGHRIRAYLQAKGLMHLAPQMFREPFGSVPDQPGIALDPEDAGAPDSGNDAIPAVAV